MINFGSPIINPLIIPDGTVDDGDRYHFLNLYFGITLSDIIDIWTIQDPDSTSWSDQTPDNTIWSVQTKDSTTWTDQE